jgi:hypothetical protein
MNARTSSGALGDVVVIKLNLGGWLVPDAGAAELSVDQLFSGPHIVHRERLPGIGPADRILHSELMEAIERAKTWVRRNLREWPYSHRLAHRVDGCEVLFWFEPEDV